MIKMKVESNEQEVDQFIEELKKDPLLEKYDIDVFNANDFALYASEQRNCLNCKGFDECKNTNQGYTTIIKNNNFVLTSCHFRKAEMARLSENNCIKTLLATSSKRFTNVDIKDFNCSTEKRTKIYKYILEFINAIQNNKYMKGLYIYGSFSTGKTFILGCIAKELARKRIETLSIYFPDLVIELKASMYSSRYGELLNYIKTVPVLLLDDFCNITMTTWLRDEIIGPILNYRMMEEKPTFFSSNVDPGEDLIHFFDVNKDSLDKTRAHAIKERINGLAKSTYLDNAKYDR